MTSAQQIPRIEVTAVTLYENNGRTIEFSCVCGLTHRLPWPIGHLQIGNRQASCGSAVDVHIPDWAYGTRSYRSTRNVRDDNAFDDPAINWEE